MKTILDSFSITLTKHQLREVNKRAVEGQFMVAFQPRATKGGMNRDSGGTIKVSILSQEFGAMLSDIIKWHKEADKTPATGNL